MSLHGKPQQHTPRLCYRNAVRPPCRSGSTRLLLMAILPCCVLNFAQAREDSPLADSAATEAAAAQQTKADTIKTSAQPENFRTGPQGASPFTAQPAHPLPASGRSSDSVHGGEAVRADTLQIDSTVEKPAPSAPHEEILRLRDKVAREKTELIHRRKKISRRRLDRLQIQKVPAVQGDPIRAITTLPGVTTQSDASVRPFVRGGKAEETRVFWDNLPLLQPYHFGGLYSLFNVESIEDINIYSGAFPVEGNNALSGAIFLRSRPAPLDSLKLFADLSLLRANFYSGIPIIKDKAGAYFSYQTFWYDFFYNRALDGVDLFVKSEAYTKQKKDFRKYVDLPNYRDLQFGTALKPHRDIHVNYVGLLSRDIFSNLWQRGAYYVNGEEVAKTQHTRHFLFSGEPPGKRAFRNIFDTLAIVRVDNNIHNVNLTWQPGQKWRLHNSAALQQQQWHVEFFQGDEWEDNSESWENFEGRRIRNSDGFRFKLKRELYSYKAGAEFFGFKNHEIATGFSYDYLEEKFDTEMLRVFFEMLYNGNSDLLSSIGHYNTEGFVITTSTPGSMSDLDYMGRLLQQINFKHKGKIYGSFYGFYTQDTWNITPNQRLIGGLRMEYEERAEDWFPSPRLSYFLNLNKSNELTFATGLYSQNDMPFYIRHSNPRLYSEKAFHLNSEWTHYFSPDYRLEWQNYCKFYWDLVTSELENTRELKWGEKGIGQHDSLSFLELGSQQQQAFRDLYGERRFQYQNGGVGNAFGAELTFFYDPVPVWNGWISAEISQSNRRDKKGGNWYNYRHHRPWIINWVNYFKFPNSPYEASIRARYAAGLPYTDFKEDFGENSDTLLYIGPMNGKRYMAYQRVDMRLTHSSLLFGRPFQYYIAVWNFFNRPNFLLRDRKNEEVKFFNFNYPIPLLFFGMSYRW